MNIYELRDALRLYLDRPTLADESLNLFLAATEGEINRALVGHPRMQRRATYTVPANQAQIPFPSDLLQLVELRTADDAWKQYPPGARLQAQQNPPAYIVVGSCADLYPVPTEDTEFTLDYAAALTPLTNDAPANWLSTQSPDVYLYGGLCQAAIWLRDDVRLATWEGLYRQYLADLSAQGWGQPFATAPRVRRV